MDNAARPIAGRLWPVLATVALAAIQLVGTFRAAREQVDDRPLDLLAMGLLLTGPAALVVLRRRPGLALGVVTTATLTFLLRDYAYGPVVLSQVVATVLAVVRGHRLAAWTATGALLVLHLGLRAELRDESWSWGAFGGVTAWALVILGVGELIRVRRERALTSRRASEERQRRQANEERLRIARELHDTVAHHMSLINMQASVALHVLDRRPEQAEVALGVIRDASKEGLDELRSLVAVLRDEQHAAPREPTATLRSLDEVLERTQTAGLSVDKVVTGAERPLPTAVELAAYRIVQEAITNILRHADASRVRVVLDYRDVELDVQVEDDGRGLEVAATSTGSGVLGMRERAQSLGGTLHVDRSSLGGTRVAAVLPLRGGP
ncbi:MAG: sensor histidine kinase [Nocardioidaceae bacterium]